MAMCHCAQNLTNRLQLLKATRDPDGLTLLALRAPARGCRHKFALKNAAFGLQKYTACPIPVPNFFHLVNCLAS